jgi:hypothetical protein
MVTKTLGLSDRLVMALSRRWSKKFRNSQQGIFFAKAS